MNWSGFGTRGAHAGEIDLQLWLIAVLFFGVGDLVTTAIGLGVGGVSEGSPIAALLIQQYGPAVMVLPKLVVFGGSYAIWRLVPEPHRLGSPLALAVLGVAVTFWNILVLTAASV